MPLATNGVDTSTVWRSEAAGLDPLTWADLNDSVRSIAPHIGLRAQLAPDKRSPISRPNAKRKRHSPNHNPNHNPNRTNSVLKSESAVKSDSVADGTESTGYENVGGVDSKSLAPSGGLDKKEAEAVMAWESSGHVRHVRAIFCRLLKTALITVDPPSPQRTEANVVSSSAERKALVRHEVTECARHARARFPVLAECLVIARGKSFFCESLDQLAAGALPPVEVLHEVCLACLFYDEWVEAKWAEEYRPSTVVDLFLGCVVRGLGRKDLADACLPTAWISSLRQYADHIRELVREDRPTPGRIEINASCSVSVLRILSEPLMGVQLKSLDLSHDVYPSYLNAPAARENDMQVVARLLERVPLSVESIRLELRSFNVHHTKLIAEALAQGCMHKAKCGRFRSITLEWSFRVEALSSVRRLLRRALTACDKLELLIGHESAEVDVAQEYGSVCAQAPWYTTDAKDVEIKCAEVVLRVPAAFLSWAAHPAVTHLSIRMPGQWTMTPEQSAVTETADALAAATHLRNLSVCCLRAQRVFIPCLTGLSGKSSLGRLRSLVMPILTDEDLAALSKSGVLRRIESFGTTCLTRSWAETLAAEFGPALERFDVHECAAASDDLWSSYKSESQSDAERQARLGCSTPLCPPGGCVRALAVLRKCGVDKFPKAVTCGCYRLLERLLAFDSPCRLREIGCRHLFESLGVPAFPCHKCRRKHSSFQFKYWHHWRSVRLLALASATRSTPPVLVDFSAGRDAFFAPRGYHSTFSNPGPPLPPFESISLPKTVSSFMSIEGKSALVHALAGLDQDLDAATVVAEDNYGSDVVESWSESAFAFVDAMSGRLPVGALLRLIQFHRNRRDRYVRARRAWMIAAFVVAFVRANRFSTFRDSFRSILDNPHLRTQLLDTDI